MITAHCPNLAALPTADGFTASSDLRHMVGDAGAFAMTQVRRAARKASQRLLGKSKFYTVGAFMADAPGFMGKLRASRHLQAALARLKAIGLFNAEVSSESLRDVHVGRVITVGMFLGEIEGHG